ncbi:TetR/AcrR family transcriptional regulator [Nocardioides sambongensis]|uniref:TetR/AcrR family transcriptional regulator n=1 Tax=Nocardioides sambongensis TaxID=2589074 RepID=UPI00112CD7A0|nr:TetR family transcriptional regulator [Nocardioides sambongensis]
MSPEPSTAARDRARGRTERTRAALVDTAERMIAERGTAVSLREISSAAGQRNHSAAQYHFGSREGLVTAVIRHRSAPIDTRRRELLEQVAPGSGPARVTALVAVLVQPWVDVLADSDGDSCYLRFLAQVLDDPDLRVALGGQHEGPDAVREVNEELARLLAHLPAREQARRIAWASAVALRLLAHEERRGTTDAAALRTAGDDLVRMLTALLAG